MSHLVSIVLPVYNTEKYIFEAVSSCLNQTYKNIELIVIDNCSSDKTIERLSAIRDPRMVLVKNSSNMGLIYSLNLGFKKAKGKYIARMDADDICFLDRIEKQVAYLESHPDVCLLGGGIVFIDPNGKVKGMPRYLFTEHAEIQCDALFRCPLNHPTVMFNRLMIENEISIGLYKEEYFTAEDYELWVRLLQKYIVQNISDPVLYYRRHTTNLSVVSKGSQAKLSFDSASSYADQLYGCSLSSDFFKVIQLSIRSGEGDDSFFESSEMKLFRSLEIKNVYYKQRFNLFLIDIFGVYLKKKDLHFLIQICRKFYWSKFFTSLTFFLKGLLRFFSARVFNSKLAETRRLISRENV